MTAQVAEGGIEIAGSLKRLSSLPNAEHQRLFNAENCAVSAESRVFITGSTAAYEIVPAQGHAEYREITIIADEVPKDCFRNGITTFREHLYLACAHIRQWRSRLSQTGGPLSTQLARRAP